MAYIPYGYRMIRGKAVEDPAEAARLRRFFGFYQDGFSIKNAADAAGVHRSISNCSAMLKNPVYLGTEEFPPLIDTELFARVQAECAARSRPKRKREKPPAVIQTEFTFTPTGDETTVRQIYQKIK